MDARGEKTSPNDGAPMQEDTTDKDGENSGRLSASGTLTTDLGDDQYPHGFRFVLLAGASIVAVLLMALDQTIVGTAVPKITDEFHSLNDVSWYAAAYFMTSGAAQMAAGKIYKYYNIKWSFMVSMVVFEAGSLICGVAPSSNVLIVGRAIAGLGSAGLSVGGTTIVSFTVPPRKRPLMLGIIGMTYCVAAVLGPLLGGAFTDQLTWRWCFYINLPIGGLAAMVLLFFFHLPAAGKPPRELWWRKLQHTDPAGVSLAMGSITCFILALQYGGNTHPWSSSVVIGLIIGFAALTVAFVGWEIWQGEYAMMLLRLYKDRSLSATCVFSFFFFGSYIVLLYYLPIYFQSILDASPIRSGVDNLPLVTAAAVFALAGGIFVEKTGRAHVAILGGSTLATIAIGLIYTLDISTSMGRWVGYQFFVGASMAFAIMQGLTVAQASVGPEDLAAATSNLLFFQTIGGAFSTALGQTAFQNKLLAALAQSAPSVDARLVLLTGASELRSAFGPDVLPGILTAYMAGIKAAFAVALAFCGVAVLCSLFVPAKRLASHTPVQDGLVD